MSTNKLQQLWNALVVIGGIGIIISIVTLISGWTWGPHVYTVSAGCFALGQVNTPIHSTDPTIKRLRRQQIFGALALVLAALFMFTTNGNEWIACITIAAVLELYTAFRLSHLLESGKTKK